MSRVGLHIHTRRSAAGFTGRTTAISAAAATCTTATTSAIGWKAGDPFLDAIDLRISECPRHGHTHATRWRRDFLVQNRTYRIARNDEQSIT